MQNLQKQYEKGQLETLVSTLWVNLTHCVLDPGIRVMGIENGKWLIL